MLSVANAYLARDVLVDWQAGETDNLLDSLRPAATSGEPLYDSKTTWPITSLQRVRFRIRASRPSECDFDDVDFFSGEDLVYSSPRWSLLVWPNSWEARLALDGNKATRWRTWEPVRAGMYFEIRFDRRQRISSTVVYSHTPAFNVPVDVNGMDTSGHWRPLGPLLAKRRPVTDLRFDVGRAIRRADYGYLLVPTGPEGAAPIGNAIAGKETDWGLELVTQAGPYYLYPVK